MKQDPAPLPACVKPRCRTARRVLLLWAFLILLPLLSICIRTAGKCHLHEGDIVPFILNNGLSFVLLLLPMAVAYAVSYRICTRSSSLWLLIQLPFFFLQPLAANAFGWTIAPQEAWALGSVLLFLSMAIAAEMAVLYVLLRMGEHYFRADRSSTQA